jgi:hypothetical protein
MLIQSPEKGSENKPLQQPTSAKSGKLRQNPQPPRNQEGGKL